MKLFCHFALDRFGAECLARLQSQLDDVGDTAHARHVFVWAGLEPPPTRASIWVADVPQWDHLAPMTGIPVPAVDAPLDFDRQDAVGEVVAALASSAPLGAFINDLATAEPRRIWGPHVVCESTWTFSTSLCDAGGSALLLGFANGLAALRGAGQAIPAAHAFVATGHETASAAASAAQEIRLALAARGLQDLESLLRRHPRPADLALPLYVIGDDLVQDVRFDRDTLRDVFALSLLALVASQQNEATTNAGANPFAFSVAADGQARCGGMRFRPEAPFRAVGASAVRVPQEPLIRLLAARFCGDAFDLLARQTSHGGLDEWMRLEAPAALDLWLHEVEARAIGHAWRPGNDPKRAWRQDEVEKRQWYQPTCIRRLLKPIFEEAAWKRLLDSHGPSRMRAVPLPRWEAAVDELTTMVDDGFLRIREVEIDVAVRRVALRLYEGVGKGLSEVFAATFRDPVGAEPHRVAQALVGRVAAGIRRDRDVLEGAIAALEGADEEAEAAGRRKLGQAREELSRAIAAVPQPEAVMLRLLPLCALGIGAAFALPDRWFPLPEILRWPIGILLSLAAAGVLWERRVLSVRRRLMAVYERWLAQYRIALAAADARREREALRRIYDTMEALIRWMAAGETPLPPLPSPLGLRGEKDASRRFVVEDGDELLRVQTVLELPRVALEAARDRMRATEARLRSLFQDSLVQTNLPEIVVYDDQAVLAEYRRLLGSAPDAVETFARQCRAWVERQREQATRAQLIVPYLGPDTTPGADELPSWQHTYLLAGDDALLDAATREANWGYGFFDTVCAFIRQGGRCSATLAERLAEHVAACGFSQVTATELYRRTGARCVPPVRTAGGAATMVFIGSGTTDPFLPAGITPNEAGRARVTALVQVLGPLDADGVIYYPNRDEPVNSLGRAWRAMRDRPDLPRALQPVDGDG